MDDDLDAFFEEVDEVDIHPTDEQGVEAAAVGTAESTNDKSATKDNDEEPPLKKLKKEIVTGSSSSSRDAAPKTSSDSRR